MTRKQVSLAIVSIFFMPFILLDLKYYDDLSRLNLGYFYWSSDGRPLSELVMRLLSFGGTLTDLYPYTYLISILAASYAVYKLSPKEYGVGGIIIASLCFVTFNYIPNAAYRFDNITMTLSLALSIIAGTTIQSRNLFFIKVFLIFASLNLYQASLGAYFCVSIFYVFLNLTRGKCLSGKYLASIFIPPIISVCVYKLFVVSFFVSGEYATSKSKTISNAHQFFTNIIEYTNFIRNNTNNVLFLCYISLFLFCSITCILIILKDKGLKYGISTRIFISLSPLFVYISTPSFMLLFDNIPNEIRAYSSFGVSVSSIIFIFISSLTLLVKRFENLYIKLSSIVAFIYAIYVLTSVSAFYNVSADMVDKYKNVAYTVAMHSKRDNSQCLSISGRMPQSGNELNVYAKYPFIKHSSPQYADHYLSWMVFYVNNYGYNMRSCDLKTWENAQKNINTHPVVFSSNLFDIRSSNDVLYLDFKN